MAALRASVILTCLDEAETIPRLLEDLSKQRTTHELELEFIVVDGGSTDGTWSILKKWSSKEPRAKIIRKTCRRSEGRNRALLASTGDLIIVVDADCRLAPDFCLRFYHAHIQAGPNTILGGQKYISKDGSKLSMVAACLPINGPCMSEIPGTPRRQRWNSPFTTRQEPYAAVTGCVAYPRKILVDAGGFHPHLDASEDGELHQRILDAGHEIAYDPAIAAIHPPRKTAKGLWKQIFSYGRGQAQADFIRPSARRWGHLLPPSAILGGILLSILGIWWQPAWWVLGAATYTAVFLAGVWAIRVCQYYETMRPLATAFLWWFLWQISWGLGHLRGMIDHGQMIGQQVTGKVRA